MGRLASFTTGDTIRFVVLCFFAVFYALPIYLLAITSLKPFEDITFSTMWVLPKSFYVDGIIQAWTYVSQNFISSIIVTVPASILSSILGSFNGYLFAKWRFPGSRMVFLMVLFGIFLPYQGILIPLVQVLGALDLPAGAQAEAAATLREGMRAVYVGLQLTVPMLTVVIRKCYGMAGMGTTDKNGLDLKIAWPSAEWGSLPVEGGVAAAYRREIQAAADPELRVREIETDLRKFASPVLTAEAFAVEDVIDPRDTRPYLCRFVNAMQDKLATTAGPKFKTGVRP